MVLKVAIIGTGISGMAAAYMLSPRYQVAVYEKNDKPGGHTRTLTIQYGDKQISVDTGFIVYNEVNYPELKGLFKHLGVTVQKSEMSFGFTTDHGKFEWGARTLSSVFGQRSNLVNPRFYRMLLDVYRFYKHAPEYLDTAGEMSLGELLDSYKMGAEFRQRFILPMGAAIWSCPIETMLDFPAKTFVRFFKNHGLLSFTGQHQWYTVTGGSQEYLKKLIKPFESSIRLNSAVEEVRQEGAQVAVISQGKKELYDHVVLAAHADESLKMLIDATAQEKEILGAFGYMKNIAYLHRDVNVMPKRKSCWSSWVYNTIREDTIDKLSLSYWMNSLQNIDNDYPLFVTLNPSQPIDSQSVFNQHEFMHPVFTTEAIAAQAKIPLIQGKRNIWFCGAYQRYGFHEDGLMSAVAVAKELGVSAPWH
ncbi:MAG: FAD-dependent oxidoreductase [Alphaproteobacteria bacterium]|nr:FAD-dependent oxidoreductase [Alphaproteobacteria bacterium]